MQWIKTRVAPIFATMMIALMLAAPAFAQTTETNPFADAVPDVQRYLGYGLIIGAVSLGVLVGITVGKAAFKRLAS